MRTYLHALLVLAATTLAGTAHAQLQTFDTRPNYSGSAFVFTTGTTMGQTFTNVSSVASMTYNFFGGTANGGATQETTLLATFGQWNGSAFIGGTTVSFGTVTIPASGGTGWSSTLTNNTPGTFPNYEVTFDLTSLTSGLIDSTYGYLTNPSNTYALMLTNQSGNTNLGLGMTQSDVFAYGAAQPLAGLDWTFAQIVITPGNVQLTPVPESSTVAALAGATFLTGLVIKRRRQKFAAANVVAA